MPKYFNTTMVYTHILEKSMMGVRSPLDFLGKDGKMRLNPIVDKPAPEIEEQFRTVIKNRYHDDLQAAILAFVNLQNFLILETSKLGHRLQIC